MQQHSTRSHSNDPEDEEFSFRQIINERKDDLKLLWKFKTRLFFATIIGGLAGTLLSFLWPVSYTARLTFVVEESKSGGSGLMSALAGQFGFDVSSLTSSSGVLSGDNVQELLHSTKLIKQTLLSPYPGRTNYTLADRYADAYGLKRKWENKYLSEGEKLHFSGNTSTNNRITDSLLQVIILQINEKELDIRKPDKKLSFFELTTTLKDENLSSLLCSRLITAAGDFYIRTKTERLRTNVNRLQVRADSIAKVLNKKTYSASAANQILLDVNPAYTTANVGSELQERDKMVLSTIYSEVVKNLEVSKTMLIQETPVFQLVDEPELPLKKNRLGYAKGIFSGALIGFFVLSFYLILLKKDR